MSDYDEKRQAYDAARAKLSDIIDNPDKTVSVDEYRARIRPALKAVRDAHEAMMAAWA